MATRGFNTLRLVLAAALLALGGMVAVGGALGAGQPAVSLIDVWILHVPALTGAALFLVAAGYAALICARPVLALSAAIAGLAAAVAAPAAGQGQGGIVATVVVILIAIPLVLQARGHRQPVPVRVLLPLLAVAAGVLFWLDEPVLAVALLVAGPLALPEADHPDDMDAPGITQSLVIPLAVFLVIVSATLALWQGAARQAREAWVHRSEGIVERFYRQIEHDLGVRVDALERMAHRWEHTGGTGERAWRQDAAGYLSDFQGLEGIAVLWADGGIRWLQGRLWMDTARPEGFAAHPRVQPVLEAARETGQTRMTSPVQPASDTAHVYLVIPLYGDGEVTGFLLSVRRLSGLFRFARGGTAPGYVFQVIDGKGDRMFGPPAVDDDRPYAAEQEVAVLGARWRVAAWPGTTLLRSERGGLPDAVALGGVSLALAGLLVMRLTLVARGRALLAARQATALHHEIEERERLEAERRATARRLEETLDHLADGFFTLDNDDRITYVNRAAARAVGMDRDYLGGQYLWNLFPENRDVYGDLYEAVRADGQARDREIFDVAFNRWIDVRAYPVLDGLAVWFRDISETKRSRDQLLFQGQVLEQIHDAVIGADLGGAINFWNRGAERLFGYAADEARNQPLRMLRPGPEYLSLRQQLIDPVLRNGAHDAQIELEDRHGRRFMARVSLSLTRNESGRALGMLLFVLDVSDRFRFEQELQDALARAQSHAARLRELARISLALNTQRSRQRTLETLVNDGRHLVEAHLCRVSIDEREGLPGGETIVSRSEKYADEARAVPRAPEALRTRAQRTGDAYRLTQAELAEHAPALAPLGAWLAVPLSRHDGSSMGMLEFADRYTGEFTPDDEAVAVQLAQLAGAVLDKADALDRMRRAEAEYREQLEFLTTVTRSVAEGILAVDAHGYVEYVNPHGAWLLGQDSDAIRGQRLAALLGHAEPVSGVPGTAADTWRTVVTRYDGSTVALVLQVSRLAEGRWHDGQVVVFREADGASRDDFRNDG
ncbi:PAS domain S-box protein [Aquisalimonas lutea]|uniref:PAS domain S-box protein n=1 Tax=Aquisalimonas lutea TaxID=1327750 RepID=UPI0025B615D3|nr:PAS domain S-box protein [Aquisalimonas lutea]MDN3518325.1 PAS domain S-box protein [Aquisalimonas lutea]